MSLPASLDVDASPDTVTFEFTVRNDGDDSIDVQLRSAKHADVAVFDVVDGQTPSARGTASRAGDEVWRWSDGQLFAQMIQSVSFDPGHAETYEFEWENPEPGDYEAVATLNAMDEVSAREPFSV